MSTGALGTATATDTSLEPPQLAGDPTAPASPGRARFALRLAAAALQIGILGDILLRDANPGVGLTLWFLVIALFIVSLAWHRWHRLPARTAWLLAPVTGFALLYTIRDGEATIVLGTLALLSALTLVAVSLSDAGDPELWTARVRDYIWNAIEVGSGTIFGGFPLLFSDVRVAQLGRSRWAPAAIATARALIVAIPLVLIFGALFRNADPVFDRMAGNLLRFDVEEVLSHVVPIAFMSWFAAGYLRHTMLASRPMFSRPEIPLPSLGAVEVGIILGVLNTLFLTFVAVQFRYLFGGEAFMRATTGLSLAEFARRGFFELVTVTGLSLPVLLCGRALVRESDARAVRLFRILATGLVGLLFVIMASALHRMLLYVQYYGLTTDRVYATAIMAWLAIVMAWLTATVLRDRPRRFAAGMLLSAWASLGVVSTLNADALVVRVNHDRAEGGATFDAAYASTLSSDAVPGLIEALVALPAEKMVTTTAESSEPIDGRCIAAHRLLQKLIVANDNWREWNLSRSRARRAIESNEAALRRMSCAPVKPKS
jgi:hypothetical protein